MAIFQRGLKKSVKAELIRYSKAITDLEDLIRAFIDIDDKLYKLVIKEKYDYRLRSSTGHYPNSSRERNRFGKKARGSDPYSLELIELDST